MQLPEFLQIPCLLMEDENLNQLDWFVYALVHWYSKQSLRRCTLKNFEMAELLKCSPGSISNSVARLKEHGYIEVLGSFKNRTGLVPLVSYSVQKRQFVPSTNGSIGSVPSTNGTVPSTDVTSRGYLPTPNNNNNTKSNEQSSFLPPDNQVKEVKSGFDTYQVAEGGQGAIVGKPKLYPGQRAPKSPLELEREKRTKEILTKILKRYGINMFVTKNHQHKALVDILDHSQGSYDEDDIFGCIDWLLQDQFWKEHGFDLRTVKNQLPKYSIAKQRVIIPQPEQKSTEEIRQMWAEDRKNKPLPMDTEEYKKAKEERLKRAKIVEAARKAKEEKEAQNDTTN